MAGRCSMDERAPELDALVAGLTPAQRRAVRNGGVAFGRGYWAVCQALIEKGLFTSANRIIVRTGLGNAAALRLQEIEHEHLTRRA